MIPYTIQKKNPFLSLLLLKKTFEKKNLLRKFPFTKNVGIELIRHLSIFQLHKKIKNKLSFSHDNHAGEK